MSSVRPPYLYLAAMTIGAAIAIATLPRDALPEAVIAGTLALTASSLIAGRGCFGAVTRRALFIGPFIVFLALLEAFRGGFDERVLMFALELPIGAVFAGTFVIKSVAAAMLGIAWGERVGAHGIARTLQRIHVPVGAVATTYITASFVGTLKAEWDNVRLAANARGLNHASVRVRLKQFGGTIASVLVRSLRRGDRLALAMRARGFSGRLPAPLTEQTHYGWRETAIAPLALAVIVVAILRRVSGGIA